MAACGTGGCCVDTVSGAPETGGGSVEAATASTWREIYRVDFRDVFADQGLVDLSTGGNTVVIDGVTWTATPTMVATTQFEINASGLQGSGIDNSRQTNSPTAPAINVALEDLLPVAPFVTSQVGPGTFEFATNDEVRFEVFISAQNGATATQWAGISMLTPPPGGPLGPDRVVAANNRALSVGKGADNVPSLLSNLWLVRQDPGTNRTRRADAPVTSNDVAILHYRGHNNTLGLYCSPFGGSDFPADSTIRPVCSWQGSATVEDEYYGDPIFTELSIFISDETLTEAFNATIQQFRILRKTGT